MRFTIFTLATIGTYVSQAEGASLRTFPTTNWEQYAPLDTSVLTQVTVDTETMDKWAQVAQTALVPYDHALLSQSYSGADGIWDKITKEIAELKNAVTGEDVLDTMDNVAGYVMKAFSYFTEKLGWIADYVVDYLQKGAEALGFKSVANIIYAMQILSKKPAQLKEILQDPSKVTVAVVIEFLKDLPLIGEFFAGIQSVGTTLGDMATRIINKTDENKCYRPVSLRSSFAVTPQKPCNAPDKQSSDTCYQACPADKEKWGNICIKKCPTVNGVEWFSCGMLCTKDKTQCAMKGVWDTLDLYNAGSILAGYGTAGLATNFVWLIDAALRLVETFSFPDCGKGQGQKPEMERPTAISPNSINIKTVPKLAKLDQVDAPDMEVDDGMGDEDW